MATIHPSPERYGRAGAHYFLHPPYWLRRHVETLDVLSEQEAMRRLTIDLVPGAQSEGHVSEEQYKLAAAAFRNPDSAKGLRELKELFREAEKEQRNQEQARWRSRVRLIGADGRERAHGSA